jgi:predicted negative regulator of RcsB-dependent stress response
MADPHLTSEDRFVSYILQFANWAQRNTRALILGLAAAAIVIFAVKYYIDYKQRVRDVAATELRNIRMVLEAGQPDQVIEQLRTYIVQFDGTTYAREARVLLAHSLLLGNRAAEAIDPARQAVDALGDDLLSLRAGFLLAAAYEEVADTGSAIAVYQQIGRDVDMRVQRTRALEAAARLLDARGDYPNAVAIYERLAELTPEEAPAQAFYLMRAAEMRAKLAGPTAVTISGESGTESG